MKKRKSRKDEPLLIAAMVAILLVLAVGVYFATRSRSKPNTPATPPAKPQLKTKTWIHGVCTTNDPGNGTCKPANYSDGVIAFSQKYDDTKTGYTYNDVMKQCKDAMITCGRNFRNNPACCGEQKCNNNSTEDKCKQSKNCRWEAVGCNTGLLV